MTPKDVSELFVADPEAFESHVLELVSHSVPSRDFPAELDGASAAVGPATVQPVQEAPIFDPRRARVSLARLDAPPEPRKFIVDKLIPSDVGVLNGPGGTGKTSLLLYECASVVLGRTLYGREILRPGGVLYVSQEDSAAKLMYRLSRIVQDMQLTRGERERIAENFFIEDLQEHRVRLVESDKWGNLTRTPAAAQLIEQYATAGLSLVIFDPIIYFSAGERYMNDGGAELMLAGRSIASALDCAVEFVQHVSIVTSRTKTDDQYAGRSAASLADNARSVRNLWPYAHTDGAKFGGPPPSSVSKHDISQRRLLVLKQPKISDSEPIVEPIWVLRNGWTFTHIEHVSRTRDEIELDDARRVCVFLDAEEGRGLWYTAKTLEGSLKEIGLTREQLRAIVPVCEQKGWIIQQAIPHEHPFRHGKRTHRLAVGVRP